MSSLRSSFLKSGTTPTTVIQRVSSSSFRRKRRPTASPFPEALREGLVDQRHRRARARLAFGQAAAGRGPDVRGPGSQSAVMPV